MLLFRANTKDGVFFFSPCRQLRELRSSSVTGRGSGRGSVGSLSPNLSSSGSPHAPNRSPAGIKRRPASFHARTPRTPRPNDLKVTPFSRMLNPPTSVDSLPRLRRFTSSQCQLSSFAYLGHEEKPGKKKDSEETAAQERAGSSQLHQESKGEQEEEPKQTQRARSKGEDKPRRSAEVLQQPLPENKKPASSRVQAENQDRRDLVEVPLSGLKPPEGSSSGQEMEGEEDGDDQKMCCGFFFKVNEAFKMMRVCPAIPIMLPFYHFNVVLFPG